MPVPAAGSVPGITIDELIERFDADESESTMLEDFLFAAQDMIAEYIGSPVSPVEVSEQHPRQGTIILLNQWTIGPATVTDSNGGTVSGYTIGPGGVLSTQQIPGFNVWTMPTSDTLTVTYVAGFDPLPDALRQAIIYTVQHAYESQKGAVPVSYGGSDETFVTSRGFALPNRAKEYLAPYRRGPRVG